ncbi:aminotransferase class V-fold PLP-dependent enzyme [Oceaniglobus indicus]|uniref:aminotransferase class V-fold PLP-dependent enzyme n=1 Tax=Oceaniglobus indicus TaxID=2047749 RepID=UPI000C18EB9A|nr:aminotransferase class V-fold PLP-dependent enzyme [Oceaniglobus indicus]
MSPLEDFAHALRRDDIHAWIQGGLIGDDARIDGPFGDKPLIYADYVASGRALAQVEDFMRDRVLPYYANSHTQASYCGAFMTKLREAARATIARLTGAGPDTSVIFTGAGSTAGINRIVGLLEIDAITRRGDRAVVLIGPYEHHSNLLPWRESGAEVVEIAEAAEGGPDMTDLGVALEAAKEAALIVGAFSAASNVTGIITDTDVVTRLLKQHGALAIWDYGCAGPYLPMDMKAGTDAAKDAIVFSSHKFPGGPGASGITVIRDAIATRQSPTLAGGGTVSFVSPWGHVYSRHLSHREEGGTPNVTGDIRAALCLMIKDALGQEWLIRRQNELRERALTVWRDNPNMTILGRERSGPALPIFSFMLKDDAGAPVHHQFFTRLLSDLHGVQARGGCACAGSYAHRLLNLDKASSDATFAAIAAGTETDKPGWVRLNLSALMSDAKVDTIIAAVDSLARKAADYRSFYVADTATARYTSVDNIPERSAV